MDELKREAEKILISGLNLKPQDKFVLLYDAASVKMAVQVMSIAESINGNNSSRYCLENYLRADNGELVLKFSSELRHILEEADASFFMTENSREKEIEYLREPMMDFIRSRTNLRHAHAPQTTEAEFMNGSARVDYSKSRP